MTPRPESPGGALRASRAVRDDTTVGLRAHAIRLLKWLLVGGSRDAAIAWARQLQVPEALAVVQEFFDAERLRRELPQDTVKAYYAASEWAYRLFHSPGGSVHMALNADGVFDPAGYEGQARFVRARAQALADAGLPTRQIVEMGCGKGYNSALLAAWMPDWRILGIDRTPAHLQRAQLAAARAGCANLSFEAGDFNALTQPAASASMVFAVECLCYAVDPRLPLREAFRVLAPGGEMIVFDGFNRSRLETLDADMRLASDLAASAMSVQQGLAVAPDWLDAARAEGFTVVDAADLSAMVLPNMRHLQERVARAFLAGWRGRLFARCLPHHLAKNAVAGLLMPLIYGPGGSTAYMRMVLRKPQQP